MILTYSEMETFALFERVFAHLVLQVQCLAEILIDRLWIYVRCVNCFGCIFNGLLLNFFENVETSAFANFVAFRNCIKLLRTAVD